MAWNLIQFLLNSCSLLPNSVNSSLHLINTVGSFCLVFWEHSKTGSRCSSRWVPSVGDIFLEVILPKIGSRDLLNKEHCKLTAAPDTRLWNAGCTSCVKVWLNKTSQLSLAPFAISYFHNAFQRLLPLKRTHAIFLTKFQSFTRDTSRTMEPVDSWICFC